MALSEMTVRRRTPHAGQKLFLDSPKKRILIKAGRRGGKTTGLAILAVDKFMQGKRVVYAAPVADQCDTFWSEVCQALQDGFDQELLQKNETKREISIAADPHVQLRCRTAWNANTLRGGFADLLILDEFQLMSEDVWGRAGAPMLADSHGDAVFLYTPPSLESSGTSKAKDKMHALRMWKAREDDDLWECVTYSSHTNPHISAEALDLLAQDMTSVAYRQEILAENVDEAPGALWKREMFESDKLRPIDPDNLARIVVSIDPPGSRSGAECGIIVAGLDDAGIGYVLDDLSAAGLSPEQWASRAIKAYHSWQADRLVAEINYGGDMVRTTIEAVDKSVAFREVRASRGKHVRAEPVAARYERGEIFHTANFPALEDQLCLWTESSVSASPDRLDALVWAFNDLVVRPKQEQAIGLPTVFDVSGWGPPRSDSPFDDWTRRF